jgi:hypothetical protein
MKKIIFVFLITGLCNSLMAQKQPKNTGIAAEEKEKKGNILNSEKIYVGGWIGAQFGLITFINLSPFLAYRFHERASVGLGLTYQYFRDNRFGVPFTFNMYGPRVFSRFHISDQLFLHAEYEYLLSKLQDNNGLLLNERWRGEAFVGMGYLTKFGSRKNSGLFIKALYNLTYNQSSSFYPSPLVLRIGYQF